MLNVHTVFWIYKSYLCCRLNHFHLHREIQNHEVAFCLLRINIMNEGEDIKTWFSHNINALTVICSSYNAKMKIFAIETLAAKILLVAKPCFEIMTIQELN